MSTAKHTPAPWRAKALQNYDNPGHAIFWEDRSKPGVHTRRLDYKGCFTEADACLVSAAPDLLEALQRAHMALIGYLPAHRNPITDAAIDHAAAAIAKATEGQS